jgi:hypothetical protein
MRQKYMATHILDTYQMVKEFREAGFSEKQAEAQMHAAQIVFHAAIDQTREEINYEGLATKIDLKSLALKSDLHKLDSKFTLEIEKVRGEITHAKISVILWVFGMLMTQTGLVFGFFGSALGFF